MKTPPGTRAAWVAEQQGLHHCQCGCNEVLTLRPEHYPNAPRFVHGHARRGQFKPRPEQRSCACLCGLLAMPGKDYISGHNTRLRTHTEETKEKIRQSKLGERNPQFGKTPPNTRPAILCVCGCGNMTSPGRRYVTGHNTRGTRMSNYRGWFMSGEYVRIHAEDHPFSDPDGYVLEHRLVAEQSLREEDPESPFLLKLGLKLYLRPEVVVHHIDGVKNNNERENLQPMTVDDHTALHHEQGDIRRPTPVPPDQLPLPLPS